MDKENSSEKNITAPSAVELEGKANNVGKENQAETSKEMKSADNINGIGTKLDNADDQHYSAIKTKELSILDSVSQEEVSDKGNKPEDINKSNKARDVEFEEKVDDKIAQNHSDVQKDERGSLEFKAGGDTNQNVDNNVAHENLGDNKNQSEHLESKAGEEANQTVDKNIVQDNLGVINDESKMAESKTGEGTKQTVDDNTAHDSSVVSKDENKHSESKAGEEANQTVDKNIAQENLIVSKDDSKHLKSKAGEETNQTVDNNIVHDNLGVINDESKLSESKSGEETKQFVDANSAHDNSGDSKDESVYLECRAGEEENQTADKSIVHGNLGDNKDENRDLVSKAGEESNKKLGENNRQEPVSDGSKVSGMEADKSASHSSDTDAHAEGLADKAAALKNFVKEKGIVAVATILRRFSGQPGEGPQLPPANEDKAATADSTKISEHSEVSSKMAEKSSWNPLSYLRAGDAQNKAEPGHDVVPEPPSMTGRIMLYTRLGCLECKEARSFFYTKRLRYVEVNIDVFPSRKLELEKLSGSSAVPRVFFNEVLIGGLSELKSLDESGKLGEKINHLINVAPPAGAPQPPLSGEDDTSNSWATDELAPIVKKMKESIIVRDRFVKFRRVASCFLGSDAVTFLSENQSLERQEAIEFGQKMASQLFFHHVFDENLFEDGNHLYRFLEDDPSVLSQCHNMPKGIIDLKQKPIVDIASRLRFLSYAIFEAYTSEDGNHVDYRSIHGSEEFARYLRVVQELQRADLQDMSREEKLAFFINLYNMIAIHSILEWGFPTGPLERRRLFGEFKYVIGGCTYSLSDIQNGILRGNQRPPYNLLKPFGAKEKRFKVSLPQPEPLIHFALVFGSRSGPALQCYSPGSIDEELTAAASGFLTGGGLIVDANTKVASTNKILKWYSVDFGRNEMEVLKYASKYLEATETETLLHLVGEGQLKVVYLVYDWGINC